VAPPSSGISLCGVAEQPDLATLLTDASIGRFPPSDGRWSRIPLWRPGVEAIVAFTGHAFFAVAEDVADRTLAELGADGYGRAHDPSIVLALAGAGAWIDVLDVVLVTSAPRGVASRLVQRPDLRDHARARHAGLVRDDVRVLGYRDIENTSVVTIGRGLGGLPELGVQTDGATDAAALLREALAALPGARTVVAAVAPGNARALRTFLGVGFTPVASVQLYRRAQPRQPG
jgi:hypothetical protein